jgi:pyruvate/2-oxoglutarate dehydrogenase complex dihydrolipoamide dehydrogenase (E3) component
LSRFQITVEHARHALDAYFNPECVEGDAVVIIGGGLVGVETALHLVNIGKKATVLEIRDDYATDAKNVYRVGLLRKVAESGLQIITSAVCKEIKPGGVMYEKDGKVYELPCDAVLYAVGMKSNDAPYFDLYNKAPAVAQAGDCKTLAKIAGAIHSGHFAAMHVVLI